MALALDEPRDSDDVFEEQGFKFCIDKELYTRVQGVSIDAGYMGFVVNSEVPLNAGGGCGSCSGSCGS